MSSLSVCSILAEVEDKIIGQAVEGEGEDDGSGERVSTG